MARENVSIPLPGFPGQLYFQQYVSSVSSPKVNGKLKLKANPLTDSVAQVINWKPLGTLSPAGANVNNTFPFTPAQYNELYGRFVGKLRHGSASLGVTLGSWSQSRSMIVKRLKGIDNIFRGVQEAVKRKPYLKRKKDVASDFLEGEFGWVPLLADIHAICSTVCGNAVPDQWVSVSKRYNMHEITDTSYAGMVTNRIILSGNARMTLAAGVEIDNPNLWLANRLGVINPLTVAWDLVPWSFVVNMFVNVNQIIGALTDTVGLTLSNGSVTRSSRILREETSWVPFDYTEAGFEYHRGDSFSISVNTKAKTRTTGAPPMPSLSLKLPNVNFELAAIAAALVTQRVSRI